MSLFRPISDLTTTGWIPSSGGVIYDMLDEVSPNDSDYITSPPVGQGTIYYLILGTPDIYSGTNTIRLRIKGSDDTAWVRVSLLDSNNVALGTSAWQYINETFTTYSFSVTTSGTTTRVKIETTSTPGQIELDLELVGLNSSFLALLADGSMWLEELQILLDNDAISFV